MLSTLTESPLAWSHLEWDVDRVIRDDGNETPVVMEWFQFDVTPLDSDYKLIS